MKKVVLVLSIIGLLAAGYALYLFTKKTPSLQTVIPDYTITADQLFMDFDTDEKSALIKYEGTVVQVTGKILLLTTTDSISNVILSAEEALMGGVNCSFNKLDEALQKDDMVVIKGRCQGYLTSVILNNCVLVK